MDDNNYSELRVEEAIYRFMNRDYDSNGRGGLFIVNNPRQDLREVEIWYQMHWYLNELE